MIYTQNQATDFIDRMIETTRTMDLASFLENFRTNFYPESNFDFMEKFLEWSRAENKNQFIIPHQMLYEYGITAEQQTKSVKQRIDALDLVEGTDYRLTINSEPVKQGGFVTKHQYHFTPYAFKLMLMSAKALKKHTVDVGIYRKYYLFLEEGVAYYREYQFEVCDRERRFEKQKFRLSNSYSKMYSDSLHKKIDDQTRKIDELLGYAHETKTELGEVRIELHDIHNELVETKEIADVARLHLTDKSFTSTMNPSDPDLHHYFAGTKTIIGNQTKVKFIRAQKGYMDKRLSSPDIDIEIKPFYTANGIDLGNNCLKEFQKRRKELVKRINAESAASDKQYNQRLLKEINAANKVNTIKRVYMEEKRTTPKITNGDILVDFKKLSFTYTHNPYMSYDDVIQIIKDVHNITQKSPVP